MFQHFSFSWDPCFQVLAFSRDSIGAFWPQPKDQEHDGESFLNIAYQSLRFTLNRECLERMRGAWICFGERSVLMPHPMQGRLSPVGILEAASSGKSLQNSERVDHALWLRKRSSSQPNKRRAYIEILEAPCFQCRFAPEEGLAPSVPALPDNAFVVELQKSASSESDAEVSSWITEPEVYSTVEGIAWWRGQGRISKLVSSQERCWLASCPDLPGNSLDVYLEALAVGVLNAQQLWNVRVCNARQPYARGQLA